MRKYLIIFLLTAAAAATVYFLWPRKKDPRFVSVTEEGFSLHGKDFYPVVMNYIVSAHRDGNQFWASPYKGYDRRMNKRLSKDSCLLLFRNDMDLIRDMGFNVVRLVSIGEEFVNANTGKLSIRFIEKDLTDTAFVLETQADYDMYFKGLEEMFAIVRDAGLKTILLTRVKPDYKSSDEHMKKLLTRFGQDSSIMAWDLFNEPLYFDMREERPKKEVYKIVKRWKKDYKKIAPDQLFTFGLTGVLEVYEWDPNMLDIDFLSFHPYEYEPGQVMSEMYWYHKCLKKPWIIGETAIAADNDSISYDEQKRFAEMTMRQAWHCGAIGYSWWQYKDVEWQNFHMDYMGAVNLKDSTKTSKGSFVQGTIKPVIAGIKAYKPGERNPDSCRCPGNYYNFNNFKTFRMKGRITDEDGDPIENAVINAWNEWWSKSHYTYSKKDGSFELYGNFTYHHWMVSSSMSEMVRGDADLKTTRVEKDGIPTVDVGTIKVPGLDL